MAHENGFFPIEGGPSLEYALHVPHGARAGLLVVHGFAEHGARYRHVVGALGPRGVAVMTFDLRGHGRSPGQRGFIARFEEYLEDLAGAREVALRRLPGPVFLLGHSMGGLVATRWMQEHPTSFAGLVLSSPAIANAVHVPAWKKLLGHIASKLAPGLAIPAGIPPEHLSHDETEVRAYVEDPLVLKDARARWYTELLAAQAIATGRASELRAPVLGLLGTGDLVCDPAATQRLLDACASKDKTVRTYDGLYHEIFNERQDDRRRVLADLGDWLLAHAGGDGERRG